MEMGLGLLVSPLPGLWPSFSPSLVIFSKATDGSRGAHELLLVAQDPAVPFPKKNRDEI